FSQSLPVAVPLHAARFGRGRSGPAATRRRAAQRTPRAGVPRTPRRRRGGRAQRHLFVVDGEVVVARDEPHTTAAAEYLIGTGTGALQVGELDLPVGERRISDQS